MKKFFSCSIDFSAEGVAGLCDVPDGLFFVIGEMQLGFGDLAEKKLVERQGERRLRSWFHPLDEHFILFVVLSFFDHFVLPKCIGPHESEGHRLGKRCGVANVKRSHQIVMGLLPRAFRSTFMPSQLRFFSGCSR